MADTTVRVITGFHAIEEKLRSLKSLGITPQNCKLEVAKLGPRVKKIVEQAKNLGILVETVSASRLDALVKDLPEAIQDHRGIVLVIKEAALRKNQISLDSFCAEKKTFTGKSVVVILDSVTDPYNVGAIMRSCDQFGVDVLILPERRSAKDGEVIERASAGAASYLPTAIVPNLATALDLLKDAGYWVYGADAGGKAAPSLNLTGKTVLIMGSEGSGMSRLLREKCDEIISIPTCGKIDSLNVSVATGVLLYEIYCQNNQ